jgi:predicted small secreted protein
MKKNKIVVLLAVIALLLASLACNAATGGGDNTNSGEDGFSVTTANITNAHLASDESDTSTVTSYSPSDPGFYCYFDLNNAPESTVVKGVWTLVSAEGYESNSEIDSAEITGSDNTYYFSLGGGTDPWPVGTYKIDLYIDGKLVETIEFEVQ